MADADVLSEAFSQVSLPRVSTVHGEHMLMGSVRVAPIGEPLLIWKSWRFRKALLGKRKVVAVCDSERGTLVRWADLDSHVTSVIYNGIDLTEFSRQTDAPSVPDIGLRLLFPGGSKWIKGGDLLIDAFEEAVKVASNLSLVVALDVPYGHPMRAKVSEMGLDDRVKFVGFLPKEQFRELLSETDVLVLPSRLEAFPVVILEAMASGKGIIVSSVGGIPEVITNLKNGILIKPDARALASAILFVNRNRGSLREMARNNLRDVKKYDWKVISAQYIALYSDVVKRD
jgi:glycosyltransferase involved in cell wall biosynthesis